MKQNRGADKNTSLPDALNAFHARFEQKDSEMVTPVLPALDASVPSVTVADVRSAFLRENPWKATGPDGVPGCTLRSSANRLAEVFTDIFNFSFLQSEVTTYFMKTTIILVPKKIYATCLNDYPLTSIIMKSFERLVMAHINSNLPTCLDPLQFASWCNRFTVDSISLALHSSLELLDNKDTYIRLLLIDYSSTFNTLIQTKLISKLQDLGLCSALCNQTLNFLTHRPQSETKEIQSVHKGPHQLSQMPIESIPSGCITAWSGNCSTQDRKELQKFVNMALSITQANLPSVDSIYTSRCLGKSRE
eukprot:g27871.t1